MMTLNEVQSVELRLLQHIQRLATQLRTSMPELDTLTTRAGSWSNNNGLATAFLTYQVSDDAAEDQLEVVFSVTPMDAGLNFSADVARTDGEVLASITETYVVANSHRELLKRIDQLCDIAQAGAIHRLKAILLPT